jgi:hypothetical protein
LSLIRSTWADKTHPRKPEHFTYSGVSGNQLKEEEEESSDGDSFDFDRLLQYVGHSIEDKPPTDVSLNCGHSLRSYIMRYVNVVANNHIIW